MSRADPPCAFCGGLCAPPTNDEPFHCDIGYGTRTTAIPPLRDPTDLAAEYRRLEPSRSLEDWTKEMTDNLPEAG